MHSSRQWARAAMLMFVASCVATPAFAQNIRSRFEAGAEFSGIFLHTEEGPFRISPGPGGWIGVALTSRLDIESHIAWFPRSEAIGFKSQGGQTFHLTVRARATLVQRGRLSLYGLVEPGLLRFSRTVTGFKTRFIDEGNGPSPVVSDVLGPATHFSLGLGLGADWRLSRRLSARVDMSTTLYPYSGASSDPGSPAPGQGSLVIQGPPDVAERSRVNIGLGYRFGPERRETPSSIAPARCDAGLQLAALVFATYAEVRIRREPGVSGFVSCRVFPNVFADGTLATFPHDAPANNVTGGRILQGMAGAKVGIRRDRVGLFVKVRTGVSRQSHVATSADFMLSPPTISFAGLNVRAWDVGGVIEAYSGRRWLLRIDAGDTYLPGRMSQTLFNGELNEIPVDGAHALGMAVGLGWRF